MIVIVGAVGTVAALLFAGISVGAGRASEARTRAQIAADAAALAAVAESGPYGDGEPAAAARAIAEANGAGMLSCDCPLGATTMTVEVAVARVTASARAVIDPALLRPAVTGFDTGGLHPSLAHAIATLIEASRGTVGVRSGYRSYAQQARLWHQALARYGSPERADDWVARPGSSMHERGLAVDLSGNIELAARLVSELNLPLHRPLSHEPWHFELVGPRAVTGRSQ